MARWQAGEAEAASITSSEGLAEFLCHARPRGGGIFARLPCSCPIDGSSKRRKDSEFREVIVTGRGDERHRRGDGGVFLLEYDGFRSATCWRHGRPHLAAHPSPIAEAPVRFSLGDRVRAGVAAICMAVVRRKGADQCAARGPCPARARYRGRQPRRAPEREASPGGDARGAGESCAARSEAQRVSEPPGRARSALPGAFSQPRRWVLAEIEQLLTIASQQLQLVGNVPVALAALQTATLALRRSGRPSSCRCARLSRTTSNA